MDVDAQIAEASARRIDKDADAGAIAETIAGQLDALREKIKDGSSVSRKAVFGQFFLRVDADLQSLNVTFSGEKTVPKLAPSRGFEPLLPP